MKEGFVETCWNEVEEEVIPEEEEGNSETDTDEENQVFADRKYFT